MLLDYDSKLDRLVELPRPYGQCLESCLQVRRNLCLTF